MISSKLRKDEFEERYENNHLLTRALIEAEIEFNRYIEVEGGQDPAYFCIDLKGYLIDNEFSTKLYEVDINNFDALMKQYDRHKCNESVREIVDGKKDAVKRYILEQQGKDVFEHSVYENPKQKIGDFTW